MLQPTIGAQSFLENRFCCLHGAQGSAAPPGVAAYPHRGLTRLRQPCINQIAPRAPLGCSMRLPMRFWPAKPGPVVKRHREGPPHLPWLSAGQGAAMGARLELLGGPPEPLLREAPTQHLCASPVRPWPLGSQGPFRTEHPACTPSRSYGTLPEGPRAPSHATLLRSPPCLCTKKP